MDTIGCNCCLLPGNYFVAETWKGMLGEDLVSLCPDCYSVLMVYGTFTDPSVRCIVSARRFVRTHYDWVRECEAESDADALADEAEWEALRHAEIDAEAKNEIGPDDAH